jgi:hypothetical protein
MDAVSNAKDYNWVFWNEFTFELPDGKEFSFRRDVGCKMKPSVALLDEAGLPTTVAVLYDAKDPAKVCLPFEYNTWFTSVLAGLIGLAIFLVGLTLALHARRPIILSGDVAINPDDKEDKP